MFSHIMVGSNNIEQSKRFYDAVFSAIGAKPGMQDEKGVNYRHNGAMLMVRPPLNGEAASHGNGSTIGAKFFCAARGTGRPGSCIGSNSSQECSSSF